MQVFSRQFATMIEAGLNIVASLVILEQQTDDPYLAEVIAELRADVEAGLLLSQAMARHPKVFDELYVSMVQAGEAAGMLDNVLDRVADQIEKETKLKRRVKGAMVYPTIVFVFACLVLVAMLLFIVPIFAKIFTELHGQLPFLTRIVLDASNGLRDYWYIIFPLLGLGICGCVRYKKTESGRQKLGPVPAARPGQDRRHRAQGHDGALLRTLVDARRRGRRHHQGARDRRVRRPATTSSRRRSPRRGSRCRKASRSRSR